MNIRQSPKPAYGRLSESNSGIMRLDTLLSQRQSTDDVAAKSGFCSPKDGLPGSLMPILNLSFRLSVSNCDILHEQSL